MRKNYKIVLLFFLLIVIFFIILFIFKNNIIKNNKIKNEYIPEEEISDSQLRETIVTLYFQNSESNNLTPEARKIDANNLIKNPYEYLINLLIEGPKNEKLKNIIPNNTKLNSIKLDGEILIIDFSEEFINANIETDDEENIINQILFTVCQLNEVNGIKILINGEEGRSFLDNKINFKDIFYINK